MIKYKKTYNGCTLIYIYLYNMNRKNTKIAAFLIALAFLASCSQKSEVVTESATPVEQTTVAVNNDINTAVAAPSTAENKIVRKARYELPQGKGEDEVEFTLTMNGDKIENVEMKSLSADKLTPPQQNFADAINAAVKGKTMNDVKDLTTVGGSSLTTEAFKEALR